MNQFFCAEYTCPGIIFVNLQIVGYAFIVPRYDTKMFQNNAKKVDDFDDNGPPCNAYFDMKKK